MPQPRKDAASHNPNRNLPCVCACACVRACVRVRLLCSSCFDAGTNVAVTAATQVEQRQLEKAMLHPAKRVYSQPMILDVEKRFDLATLMKLMAGGGDELVGLYGAVVPQELKEAKKRRKL